MYYDPRAEHTTLHAQGINVPTRERDPSKKRVNKVQRIRYGEGKRCGSDVESDDESKRIWKIKRASIGIRFEIKTL